MGSEKLNAPEAGQFFCLKTQLFGGQIFFSQINFITSETFLYVDVSQFSPSLWYLGKK